MWLATIILDTIIDVFKALDLGADDLIKFGSSVLSSTPDSAGE